MPKKRDNKPAKTYLLEGILQHLSAKPSDLVFPEYKNDPIGFVKDVLKVSIITDEQAEVCLSVRDNKVTNVQAGHGLGKTKAASWLVFWYALAVQGVVYTTAPSANQVYRVLWKEIRDEIAKNPLLHGLDSGQKFFRVPRTNIEATGFTGRNYDENSIQGSHAPLQFFVEDEAGGITAEIDGGVVSCLSDDANRLLRIGNPTPSGSAFHKVCNLDVIKISIWGHPNIKWAYEYSDEKETHVLKSEIAEDLLVDRKRGKILSESEWPEKYPRSVIPGAVSVAWVEELRVNPLRGPGTPYWISRVEGEFCEDAEDVVIPQKLWDRCRRAYDEDPEGWDRKASTHDWVLGVDVADGGADHSCIALRRGPVLYGIYDLPQKNDLLNQVRLIAKIRNLLLAFPGRVQVDATGVGASLPGNLIKEGVPDAHAIKWGARKDLLEPDRYANRKAEDFFELKARMLAGELAIAPLGKYENEAKDELCDYRAGIRLNGQFIMEKKEETIARIGHSPDKADAIVVAFTDNLGEIEGYKLVQTALSLLNQF